VVGGRTGASISAFLFPLLFTHLGEVGVIGLLAGGACERVSGRFFGKSGAKTFALLGPALKPRGPQT
jgi:hypothetical protein